MNIKKISVRFNLDKEADSKAWHYLRSVKGQSYTETVINALLNHDLADLIEEKFVGMKLQIFENFLGNNLCPIFSDKSIDYRFGV